MSEESFKHALGNIRLLDRTNYAVWKEDCMKVIQGIMAWDIVMEREEQPEDPERPNDFSRNLVLARKAYKDDKQRKLQALAIIYGSCTNAVKVYVKGMDDPVEMWKNWRPAQTLPTPRSEECRSFGNSALFVPLPDSHSMPTSPNCLISPLSSLAPKKPSPTWSSRITSIRLSLPPMQSQLRFFNPVRKLLFKKSLMHSTNASRIVR